MRLGVSLMNSSTSSASGSGSPSVRNARRLSSAAASRSDSLGSVFMRQALHRRGFWEVILEEVEQLIEIPDRAESDGVANDQLRDAKVFRVAAVLLVQRDGAVDRLRDPRVSERFFEGIFASEGLGVS